MSATSPLNLNSASRSNASRQSPCWRINLKKGARILDVVTAASCQAASAKYEAEQKGAFAEQNLMPEGGRGIENREYSLLAPGKNEKRRHRTPERALDLVLVDNAYDEDADQILTCYEI